MDRKKVDVNALTLGMYVSALDRPWLESPFLFQGFTIESEEDLRQLRECCRFVYIDLERGRDVPDNSQSFAKPTPPPRTRQSAYSAGATGRAGDGSRGSSAASTPANLHQEPDLKHAIPRIQRTRERASGFMDKVMGDAAQGKPLDRVSNTQVVRELSEAVSLNVDASIWLNVMRHKHAYTASHCVNVSVLALGFAKHLGYAGAELEAIGMGALLHDIGLARYRKELLDKQGDLLPEEWAELRRHTNLGHQILAPVDGIHPTTLDIIKHHHERIDGSGYPDGLSGSDIPREALLVAVADMYDAMTSDRPYAHSVSPHGTVSVIRRVSPTAFGRELVDEFLRFIGIYPISTVVELKNQAIGMVVSHTPKTRLKPVVLMLLKPDRSPYSQFPILDLARSDEKQHPEEWQIQRVIDPRRYKLDVAKITAIYLDGLYSDNTS